MEWVDWKRRKTADEYRESALEAARVILGSRELLVKAHLREFLDICIWKMTEAEGSSKYNTRYRSRGAVEHPKAKLQHEHVVTKKILRERLLDDPDDYVAILNDAVACTVLATEHEQLSALDLRTPGLVGWERYRTLGIDVWDCETQSWIL